MFKGGMGNLMKQARQFQDQMSKLQDEMSTPCQMQTFMLFLYGYCYIFYHKCICPII